MHKKDLIITGRPLAKAEKALILLHGRGGSAEDILSITEFLDVKEYALIAPKAEGNTWYPYSFLSPIQQNEPWLASALKLLYEVIEDLKAQKINEDMVFLAGFSQGACLTLEFAARNAKRYGGIAAFTGGLIGDKIYPRNYKGNFNKTRVFIGTSDPDPHVPVDRVNESVGILQEMNADVILKVYKNMGHTINHDEINTANRLIFTGNVQDNKNIQ